MRRAGQSGFIAILAAEAEDKGAGRAKSDGVAEAQEKIAVTEIGARGGESRGGRERVGAVDMEVGVIHLLGDMVISENLIKLREDTSFAVGGGLVVSLFAIDKELRGVGGRNEIQLPVFVDTFRGAEPERFVANNGASAGEIIVPAQKVGHVFPRNIGGVEDAVAVIGGSQAMNIIAARLGNDVDDAAGSVAELGFVAGGDDLEFGDGVLIELRGGAAAEFILIGEAVDEETGIVGALTENGRGVVAVQVGLPVNGYAWDELHQVEVVPPVDGHVHNLTREDCRALRGRSRLEQRDLRRDFDLLLDRADFQRGVEFKRAVQCNLQIFENLGAEPGVGNGQCVDASRKGSYLVISVRVRSGFLGDGQGAGSDAYFRAGNGEALTIGHNSFNRGSGLCVEYGHQKHCCEKKRENGNRERS